MPLSRGRRPTPLWPRAAGHQASSAADRPPGLSSSPTPPPTARRLGDPASLYPRGLAAGAWHCRDFEPAWGVSKGAARRATQAAERAAFVAGGGEPGRIGEAEGPSGASSSSEAARWQRFYLAHSGGSGDDTEAALAAAAAGSVVGGFFRPRRYLELCFPSLAAVCAASEVEGLGAAGSGFKRGFEPPLVAELGAGDGSCAVPLLQRWPRLKVLAVDGSARSCSLVRARAAAACRSDGDGNSNGGAGPTTDPDLDGRLTTRVVDLAADPSVGGDSGDDVRALTTDFGGACDAVLLVFLLSALGSRRDAARCLSTALALARPGTGVLLIRDYAFGDHAQGRFHGRSQLREGGTTYRRGDGTLAHFFRPGEVANLVRDAAVASGMRICVEEDEIHCALGRANRKRGGEDRLKMCVHLVVRREA